MNAAIADLMTEHRLIELVLGSLETLAVDLANGADAGRETVREYAEFFSGFADRCHHGKEEDLLFVKMTEHGFPRQAGPIAVMLSDHVEGRNHVAALAAVGAGSGPLGEEEKASVIAHARDYVPLLRSHILKEDNVLYPMAMQALPPAELEQLGHDFDVFEREVMGEGAHERFHALAEKLVQTYPPDPATSASGDSCIGCHGHQQP
jgi:hemerythrin-like domain-containing protein